MKTGYIYISSNGANKDNNAFILSEIQQLLGFAYESGLVIRQIFIDFDQSDLVLSKPQLVKLIEAMSVDHGQYVLVTKMSRISCKKEELKTFLLYSIVTNTRIIGLFDQKKKKGKK